MRRYSLPRRGARTSNESLPPTTENGPNGAALLSRSKNVPGPDDETSVTALAEVQAELDAEGQALYVGPDLRREETRERELGDFTTTPAVLRLVPLAVVIGALGAGISLALLAMIGFFTNLFYYQRLSVHLVSPNANTLGAIAIVIPIGGGLIVGLMARFGSEQIRGHGIPEAMERILINGSRCSLAWPS